jgi:nicotinic acetylcholine receptor
MLKAVLFTTLFFCAVYAARDRSTTTYTPEYPTTTTEEPTPSHHRNPRSKLRDTLLANYDKTTRPVLDLKKPNNVNVGVSFNAFDVTYEGRLESNIFLIMSWQDDFLKWNPADYDGTETLMIPGDDIWIPDVFVYNIYGEPEVQKADRLNALVYHNGSALVVPPMTLETKCELDFGNWPFDTQNCSIVLGPWVYSTDEMAVFVSEWQQSEEDAGNGKWNLLAQSSQRESKEYPCCPGTTYDRVTFSIRFQRASHFDQGLAVIPLAVVYLLAISSFMLPVGSTQRYMFNGIGVLVSLLTVHSIRENIGVSGQGFPKIALLHMINILAVTIVQVISVMILRSSRSSSGARLAALLTKVMNKKDDDDIDKLIAKEKLKEVDDTKQNASACVTVFDSFFFAAYTIATGAVLVVFSPYY